MDKQFSEHVDVQYAGVRNLTSDIFETFMYVATNNAVTRCYKSMNIILIVVSN